MKFRCRVGLHRWTRRRETDHDLENPGQSATWRTRCRDCGREQGNGTVWAGVAFLIAFAAGVWCLISGPPLLGAVLVMGSVTGLLWSAGAVLGGRLLRWLSAGR